MAQTLFINGPVCPMSGPRIERGAVLTDGPWIAYVGSADGLERSRTRGAEVVDLGGRILLPGLCDSHLHVVLAAEQHACLDCRGAESIHEIGDRIRAQAQQCQPGEWIVGLGWERKTVFRDAPIEPGLLDSASPHNPVFLSSKDMHSSWLNRTAMDRFLSLKRAPPKCVPHKTDQDELTGLIFEDMLELRRCLVPDTGPDAKRAAVKRFVALLHSHGITSVHTNDPRDDLKLVHELFQSETPRIRVLWNLVFESPEAVKQWQTLSQLAMPGWLGLGGVKLFLDGALGSMTAAVNEPYVGTADRGILNMTPEELDEWLRAIREVGSYPVFHVIGDRAADFAVQGVDRLDWPAGTPCRLEHAQLVSPELFARCDISNVVFSVQPSHLAGDREIVEKHVDPKLHRLAYAYRTMLSAGANVVFGSDAPVEDIDPWRGIHAAVTRLANGAPPFVEQEGISLFDALSAHTCNPARIHRSCFPSGVLEEGAPADLVVWSDDPFSWIDRAPHRLFDGVRVEMTFVDGVRVYERS